MSVTAKGAKMAMLSDGAGRCHFTFPGPSSAPFGPSNFDKDPNAARQNLDIRVSGETAAYFDGLDAWAVEYLCAHTRSGCSKRTSRWLRSATCITPASERPLGTTRCCDVSTTLPAPAVLAGSGRLTARNGSRPRTGEKPS